VFAFKAQVQFFKHARLQLPQGSLSFRSIIKSVGVHGLFVVDGRSRVNTSPGVTEQPKIPQFSGIPKEFKRAGRLSAATPPVNSPKKQADSEGVAELFLASSGSQVRMWRCSVRVDVLMTFQTRSLHCAGAGHSRQTCKLKRGNSNR
jgi:hypothetical protein